jgi:hypothetical protein
LLLWAEQPVRDFGREWFHGIDRFRAVEFDAVE